ncbi:MAG: ABC transporter ATP-binding protein [Phycisphaerales bacterium]|nr:ABC transporter ATP-binding protein [Phycisphaerales bacterium]
MDIIQVRDLKKVYKSTGTEALSGVSFTVKEGEIFGLLGPNGAGKSTTLEILETIKIKTTGEVIINGWNVDTHATEIKNIIGVQLQQTSFYPQANLKMLLNYFAGVYQVSIDPIKILKQHGLDSFKHVTPTQLSGGQRQKFSLAIAMINNPKIVFLDEPTTGLDPSARRALWDRILNLKREGITVIITTHYMDEAEILCDRIALIEKGKNFATDTPDNLIQNLLNKGFTRKQELKKANLEDVFIDMVGHSINDDELE